MKTLKAKDDSEIFEILNEIILYNGIMFDSKNYSGAGAIWVDTDVYIPNIIRAAFCLKEGGSITLIDKIEEFP